MSNIARHTANKPDGLPDNAPDIGDELIGFNRHQCHVRVMDYQQQDESDWIIHLTGIHDAKEHTRKLDYLLEELNNKHIFNLTRLGVTAADVQAEAQRMMSGDKPAWLAVDPPPSDSTALAMRHTQAQVEQIRERAEMMATRSTMLQQAIRQRVAAMMEPIESMRNEMQKLVELATFALYVGDLYLTEKDVVTIAEGDRAPADTPLVILQAVRYADEEYGDPSPHPITGQRGLDWQSIEDMWAWLAEPENREKVLPFPKCIVALRPSRQHRWYVKNPFMNMRINAKNRKVFLVIRNGENLWALDTGGLKIGSRLVARLDEYDDIRSGTQREKAEATFKAVAALLQGILDNTDLLSPLPVPRLDLFDVEASAEHLYLVRDDENNLGTDQESIRDYVRRINDEIQVGSRVFVGYSPDRFGQHRREGSYGGRFAVWMKLPPDPPEQGIYTVEPMRPEWRDRKGRFRILYLPTDEIWVGWNSRQRKRRLTFFLYTHDEEVLNFDALHLDEMDAILASRLARRKLTQHYYYLWSARRALLDELAAEAPFIELVVGRSEGRYNRIEVLRVLDWWKRKTKAKRKVADDEAKALRMVEAELARRQRNQEDAEAALYRSIMGDRAYNRATASGVLATRHSDTIES